MTTEYRRIVAVRNVNYLAKIRFEFCRILESNTVFRTRRALKFAIDLSNIFSHPRIFFSLPLARDLMLAFTVDQTRYCERSRSRESAALHYRAESHTQLVIFNIRTRWIKRETRAHSSVASCTKHVHAQRIQQHHMLFPHARLQTASVIFIFEYLSPSLFHSFHTYTHQARTYTHKCSSRSRLIYL